MRFTVKLSKSNRGVNWRDIDSILSWGCLLLLGKGVGSITTGSIQAAFLVLPRRGRVADCTNDGAMIGFSSTTGKKSPIRPSLLLASTVADGTRLGLAGTGDRRDGSLGWRLIITSITTEDRGSEFVEYFLTGWSAIRLETLPDWYKFPPE